MYLPYILVFEFENDNETGSRHTHSLQMGFISFFDDIHAYFHARCGFNEVSVKPNQL